MIHCQLQPLSKEEVIRIKDEVCNEFSMTDYDPDNPPVNSWFTKEEMHQMFDDAFNAARKGKC